MSKICSKCKVTKTKSEFNKSCSSKDGYNNYCRVCSKLVFKQRKVIAKPVVSDSQKYCKSCNTIKDKSDFSINLDGKDGIRSQCKECQSIRIKVKKLDPEYKAIVKSRNQAYTRRTRDKANLKSARRRAARVQATIRPLDIELEDLFLQEIYHLAVLRETATNFKWEVDHIVPLISDFVCGLHSRFNLRVITEVENKSKSNKYWPDMWLDTDY